MEMAICLKNAGLNISLSYLSAIERGEREVPKSMPDVLIRRFQLSKIEQNKILEAVSDTPSTVKLSIRPAQLSFFEELEKHLPNLTHAETEELKKLIIEKIRKSNSGELRDDVAAS